MKSKPKVTTRPIRKRAVGVVPPIKESEELRRITESASRNELVIVTGTGVSMALTDSKIPALSWKGLIADGFVYAKTKGLITDAQVSSWETHLDSSDIDDLLGAAEFIGRKLSAPHGDLYARWLEKTFKSVAVTNERMAEALRVVQRSNIPICTLNYDHLLEIVMGLPSVTLNDLQKTTSWMRVAQHCGHSSDWNEQDGHRYSKTSKSKKSRRLPPKKATV